MTDERRGDKDGLAPDEAEGLAGGGRPGWEDDPEAADEPTDAEAEAAGGPEADEGPLGPDGTEEPGADSAPAAPGAHAATEADAATGAHAATEADAAPDPDPDAADADGYATPTPVAAPSTPDDATAVLDYLDDAPAEGDRPALADLPPDGPTVLIQGVGQKAGGKQRFSHSSNPRRSQLPLNALLWIGIAFILIALGIAGYLLWRHFSALAGYNRLEDMAGIDHQQIDDPNYTPNPDDLNIDWEALRAINPDIIGWIYVPGTRLSYPIVQGQDNDYYLNHTADGNVNASGAIFLDYENSGDFSDICNYVYGHNMLGKTMFSEMTGYASEDFIREHPRILIMTPERTYDLTVIGAIKCKGTDPVRRTSFSGRADFKGFLNTLGGFLASGRFDSLANADNIYCFSTCELFDFSSRVIVIATDTSRSQGAEGGPAPAAALGGEGR